VVQYRRATANMQERYPNATEEELMAIDRTCIICREEMTVGRKLPCGHIFHFHCLRSWLERQQICPTCRTSVLQPRPQERVAPASQGTPGSSNDGGERRHTINHLAETGQRTVPPREAIINLREPTTLPGSFAVWIPASQALSSSHRPSTSQHMTNLPSATLYSPPPFQWPSGGLDDETLRKMEGDQRHHLEERLKFLASLQDHIGDLIVQITQYLDLTGTTTKEEVSSSSNDISPPSSSGIEGNNIKSSESMSETARSETNDVSPSSPP
jgi:E3 ubiquitin-protein ligase synoviolin